MKNLAKYIRGFSLVELMVGSAAGLIVIAGAIGLVISILASNSDTVKASRLNQDLNSIMAIMVNEIRRAGHGCFGKAGFTTISSLETTNTCIHYAYSPAKNMEGCDGLDNDSDGTNDELDEFIQLHYGFLLHDDGDKILMRTASSAFTCGGSLTASNWEAMNNEDEVEITVFSVTDNSRCLDNDGLIVSCTATTAPLPVVRVRRLDLSLTGRLTQDIAVTSTVQETVRIRNNEPL
ncbi:hypothetical protein [Allochromatium palmeri]|uniref:Prepilin-type N-terminal cleavage/methylation domain-containing protein n=1 Tax=Allochromatium palmeri TaxID=231048 RepID=A0A6N8EFW5_9GAMM|nr:hypothetical protein [Allochromatium palmeri]MTW23113.1 hypothetical protein [Allochromatium palmeri]